MSNSGKRKVSQPSKESPSSPASIIAGAMLANHMKGVPAKEPTEKQFQIWVCGCVGPVRYSKHVNPEHCLESMNQRYKYVEDSMNFLKKHFGVKDGEDGTEYMKCGCGGPLFINVLLDRKTRVCPYCMKLAYDELSRHCVKLEERLKESQKTVFSLATSGGTIP